MKGHTDEPEPPAPGSAARTARWVVGLVALVVLAWSYPLAIVAAAAIAGMVLMHEFGHYAAARAVGMKVTDFFLGFGPRLWSFRRGETTYGLRALPLGAYVRIIGMSRTDVVDSGDERRAFRVKSYPRRVLVVCAGSLMHLVLALFAFGLVHAVVGAPAFDGSRWQVVEVTAPSDGLVPPARAAGIEVGDRIVAVNDVVTEDWEAFVSQVQSRPGERVVLEVERDGSTLTTGATLAAHPETGSGFLGIRSERVVIYETVPLLSALQRAVADVGRSVANSAYGIWSLFANLDELVDRIFSPPGDPSANENLSTRPLGIYGFGRVLSSSSFGWSGRLTLFGFANVFIGAFNMLPLPPFDGGHLAVASYERWRERGGRDRYLSDPRKLAPVATFVASFFILLAVGLLYLDFANPVNL